MGLIDIPNPCPGVMSHINDRLGLMMQNGTLDLPDFTDAESIVSVSDYAGEDTKKPGLKYVDYQVLSFIILDWNNSGLWDLARTAFRMNKLDFDRTMEFKKLNKDKERFRLLGDFLNLFDSINGLVLTYLIHNDIRYLFTEKSPHSFLKENGYGTWKPHIAEKILRVCHLQAPIVDKLTSSKHKFLWLTDRDSITEDIDNLGKIFQGVFNTYATHGFSTFSYAKPFQDSEMRIDDLLSIPDLVAGSVLEYFHECELADKGIKDNFEIQDKSNRILVWLSNKESKLKKLTCRIYPTDGGKWAFSFLGFEKKDEYGKC